MAVDLFEVGFSVETGGLVRGLSVAERSLRQLKNEVGVSTKLLQTGFEGGARSARTLGQSMLQIQQAINRTKREMSEMERTLKSPASSSRYRALRRDLVLYGEALAKVEKLGRQAAALEEQESQAAKAAAAARRAAAKQAADDAARRIRDAKAAELAVKKLEKTYVDAAAVQIQMQRLVGAGLATNTAQAKAFATALVKAATNGATPEQLANLEALQQQLRQATVETDRLTAAEQERRVVQSTLDRADTNLLVEIEARRLLSAGMADNRREALALAEAKVRLQQSGATDNEVRRLETNAQLTRKVRLETEALEAAQRQQAATARLALEAQMTLAGAVQAAEVDQINMLERVRVAQMLVTEGVIANKAAVMQLAAEYVRLRALGMSDADAKQWVEREAEIRRNTRALELNIAETLRAASAQRALGAATNTSSVAVAAQAAKVHHSRSKFQELEHSITRLRTGLFSILSIVTILGFDKLIRGLYETALSMSQVQRGLSLVTTSSQQTGEVIGQLKGLADELGVSYRLLSENFTKFAVAAAGQLTLDESLDVFESTSMALRALGKDQVDTERVFKALEQMVGKGVISMEELRGQLGESLPSAIRLMARGLDKSIPTLTKLVAQGLLPAREGVLALSRELRKEFSGAAEQASRTLQAAAERISNAFYDIFEGGLTGGQNQQIIDALDSLARSLRDEKVVEAITAISTGIINLGRAFADNLPAIVEFVKQLVFFLSVMAGLKLAVAAVKSLAGGLAALGAALATVKLYLDVMAVAGVGLAAALGGPVTLAVVALTAVVAGGVWLWNKYNDTITELGKTGDVASAGINLMTDAQRELALQASMTDRILLEQQGNLKALSALAEDTANDMKSAVNARVGRQLLMQAGFTEFDAYTKITDQQAEKYAEAVQAAQRERERLNRLGQETPTVATASLSEMLLGTTSRGAPSFDDPVGMDVLTRAQATAVKTAQENLKAEEERVRIAENNLRTLIATVNAEKARKDALVDAAREAEKLAKSEEKAAAAMLKRMDDYALRVQTSLGESQRAIDLLQAGLTDDPQQALEFARMLGGAERFRNDEIRERIRLAIQAAAGQQRELDLAQRILDTYGRINSLREARVLEGENFAQTSAILTSGQPIDVELDYEAIGARVADAARTLKKELAGQADELERIVAAEIAAERLTKARGAAVQQILDLTRAQRDLEDAQRAADLSQSGRLGLDADLQAFTDGLRLARLANEASTDRKKTEEELVASALEYVGILERTNALLAANERLRDFRRNVRQGDLALAATQAPGFDPLRTDPGQIAADAQLFVNNGASQEQALQAAIQMANTLAEQNRQLELFTESSLRVADVWRQLNDQWTTGKSAVVLINEAFAQSADLLYNQVGDAIANVALGLTTAREAAVQLAQTILRELISALVQAAVQLAVTRLTGTQQQQRAQEEIKDIGATTAAALAAMGTVTLASKVAAKTLYASWAATAQQVAMATFGASAAMGSAIWLAQTATGAATAAALNTASGALGGSAGAAATPGRQLGGTVRAGMPYIVGEAGRELFVPPVDGRILSRDDTTRALAKAGIPEESVLRSEMSAFERFMGQALTPVAALARVQTAMARPDSAGAFLTASERLQLGLTGAAPATTAAAAAEPRTGATWRMGDRPSIVRSAVTGPAYRQMGGRVTAGSPTVVGEGGRELFIPDGAGAGGVTVPVKVTVVNNLGRQADASISEREGPNGERLVEVALNAVADDIARNGRVGRTIASRFGVNQRLGGRTS